MTVTYRRAGPERGRFDFTPAFYEENCGKSDIPRQLADTCGSFESRYKRYTKDHVYCLEQPDHPKCRNVIAAAKAGRNEDEALWSECRSLGQDVFNKKYSGERNKQRSEECAYEKYGTGGPNRLGQRWRRLKPAACWPDTYVGRDGLDCCGSGKMALGGLGGECSKYLVDK